MMDLVSSIEHPLSRTLVLGLGNPILTDDGVGIRVVDAAAARCRAPGRVTFAGVSLGGLRLLDLLAGYKRAILVDAIQTGQGAPGTLFWLEPGDLRVSLHAGSSHDLSLPAALELGRRLGMALPAEGDLRLLAIEVEEVHAFGEACTPAVAEAIPRAVEAVLAALQERA